LAISSKPALEAVRCYNYIVPLQTINVPGEGGPSQSKYSGSKLTRIDKGVSYAGSRKGSAKHARLKLAPKSLSVPHSDDIDI